MHKALLPIEQTCPLKAQHAPQGSASYEDTLKPDVEKAARQLRERPALLLQRSNVGQGKGRAGILVTVGATEDSTVQMPLGSPLVPTSQVLWMEESSEAIIRRGL